MENEEQSIQDKIINGILSNLKPIITGLIIILIIAIIFLSRRVIDTLGMREEMVAPTQILSDVFNKVEKIIYNLLGQKYSQ